MGPRWTGWGIPLLGGMLALGCGGSGPRSHDQLIPSEEAARAALETALSAWKGGQPPGKIQGTSPLVEVVDSHRRPGQRLQSYTILGEVPGVAPRCFAVRLALDEPAEEQKVRLVVLGVGPYKVFRHEDFEMLAHWEHPMDASTAKEATPADKP